MKNIVDLTNKKILITGASSGIGAETALLCSQLGAKVILVARREEKLREVLSGLEGSGHQFYSFDLANVDEIETFTKQIIKRVGPLDGFVHSAGIPGTRPFKLYKPQALRAIMDVNFSSFFEIVRCISKKNASNEGASIVGVSSISSKIGGLGKSGYSPSKAAMNGAVRSMAKELASRKIRVNTVCPGLIETTIYQTIIDNSGDSQDTKARIDRQYLGLGHPVDIANTIAFLLSDASRMITGTSINVDGGMLSS